MDATLIKVGGPPKSGTFVRALKFKTAFANTILDVMLAQGWQQVNDDTTPWDIYWCGVDWFRENPNPTGLLEHARYCHYSNHVELTRKDLSVKNLKRLRKQIEKSNSAGKGKDDSCDFFPSTFQLPSEYHMFAEEFKRFPGSCWIMKPIGSAQGKGIFLFKKLADITEWRRDPKFGFGQQKKEDEKEIESYIVQRYIPNPMLIGGKKFDLRIYVLVTSYNPLTVWLYREGFARFSGALFSMKPSDIANQFIHLTNVAIQKTADGYDKTKGCKWLMSRLRSYMISRYGVSAVEKCMREIDNIFIRSLQSVQHAIINDPHCFELYGYDILIDDALKPWLIEVNASPSLTADTPTDYDLKYGMLEDMFAVVDIENRRSGQEQRVGGFDLMWNDGPVYQPSPFTAASGEQILNSHLGGFMGDRKANIEAVLRKKKQNNSKEKLVTTLKK